jgi:putative addiction module CopG family antidote
MKSANTGISTQSIHITLPKTLKEHIEMRVAEGEYTSPSDYVRSLVRAERAYQEKRSALLSDIDAGLSDLQAGRVTDGEEFFAKLLDEQD